MGKWLSEVIDILSDRLADKKGLLPTIGLLLVIANFVVVLGLPSSYMATTNLLLHIGLIIAIFGFMLSAIL